MVRCVAITKSNRRCKKSACYSDFCATHGKLTCCMCKMDTHLADRLVLADCRHVFCKECIADDFYTSQWFDGFDTNEAIKCPECKLDVSDKHWNSITSYLCHIKVLRRKIVYDTYLCAQLLQELAPIVKLKQEYTTRDYFFIFNEWNRICPHKYGWIKYLPATNESKPDNVIFKKYTDELTKDERVFRFFYGDNSKILFEVFQKELVEYVFHPKRVQRFGGWEYLEQI